MDDRYADWLNKRETKTLPLWSEVEYLRQYAKDGQRPFFVMATTSGDGLDIRLTDFVHLWSECMKMKEFEDRFKDLNPNLEADSETMTNEIRDIALGRRARCKVFVDGQLKDGKASKSINITYSSQYDSLPLRWGCTLRQADPETFHDEIIRPLMATMSQYQRRETSLFDLLAAKDRDIDHRRMHSKNQASSSRAADTQRFRSYEWSTNDVKSKEFTKLQRNLRPDNIAQRVISNEIFASACKADVYIAEIGDVQSDSGSGSQEANRRSASPPRDQGEASKSMPYQTLASTIPESVGDVQASSTASQQPSPPASPPRMTRKKLRL